MKEEFMKIDIDCFHRCDWLADQFATPLPFNAKSSETTVILSRKVVSLSA